MARRWVPVGLDAAEKAALTSYDVAGTNLAAVDQRWTMFLSSALLL
jgi:hypothetical protein